MPKLLLLDGHSLAYRAFFALPTDLATKAGTVTNAVYGFTSMLTKVLGDERPDYIAVAFDAPGGSTYRYELDPEYKAGRKETPDLFASQLPLIREVLETLQIQQLSVAGVEADDVIATLAARSPRPVDVVSGDRDLFQVVDDERGVRVLYIAKGVARHQVIDEAEISTRYRIPGRAYAELALLRGDPSDGLPGVVGVGEKTAASLISRYGSAAAVRAAAADPSSDLRADLRRKIQASSEYLVAADPVVRVVTDVDVPDLDDRLPAAPRDPSGLLALAEGLGLDASFNRVLAAMAGAGAPA